MRTHRMLLRAAAVSAFAAVLLALAGCGAQPQSTSTPNAGAPSGQAPLAASDTGENKPSAPGSAEKPGADTNDSALFAEDIFRLTTALPTGMELLPDGSALLTDTYNRVVWQFTDGVLTPYAGAITAATDVRGRPMGGYYDSAAEESLFLYPWAIAPFLDGYAVSDAENNAVRLVRNGQVQTINATGSNAALAYPTGLAAGEDGCLYVADTHNGRVCRITPEGRMTTIAKNLSDPMGLSWRDGVLYIAETGANRILQLADGKLTVLAGQGGEGWADGKAPQALFSAPQGVLAAADGSVYVSDTVNGAVRRIRDGMVETLLIRDPAGLETQVPVSPAGLCLREDVLYVCDSFAGALLKLSVKG